MLRKSVTIKLLFLTHFTRFFCINRIKYKDGHFQKRFTQQHFENKFSVTNNQIFNKTISDSRTSLLFDRSGYMGARRKTFDWVNVFPSISLINTFVNIRAQSSNRRDVSFVNVKCLSEGSVNGSGPIS